MAVTKAEYDKYIRPIKYKRGGEGCVTAPIFVEAPNFEVGFDYSPTGNCQLMSFAYINELLSLDLPKNVIRAIISRIFYPEDGVDFRKPIMLIDLKLGYLTKDFLYKYISDDEIIARTDYESTNGSEMSIILINTNRFSKSDYAIN